jgi:hypothetical protein
MKDKKGKKIITGLASIFLFFGKNVYATSGDTSSSNSTFGLAIGAIFIIAILALGYKMDKDEAKKQENSKATKPSNNKKSILGNTLKIEEIPEENDMDIPYEEEKNESYIEDNVSGQDLNEQTEYEDDNVFSSSQSDNSFDEDLDFSSSTSNQDKFTSDYENQDDDEEDDEEISEDENTDSNDNETFSFSSKDVEDEKISSDKNLEEEDNFSFGMSDLDTKIDALEDLDEDYINEKISEFQKNIDIDTVENSSDILNKIESEDDYIDNFEGFSIAEDNNNEITSFSFGNASIDLDDAEDMTETFNVGKKEEALNEETLEDTSDKKYKRKKSVSKEKKSSISSLDEIDDNEVFGENSNSELDIGFLNQMEENLKNNQKERNSRKNKKTN